MGVQQSLAPIRPPYYMNNIAYLLGIYMVYALFAAAIISAIAYGVLSLKSLVISKAQQIPLKTPANPINA